jgi:CRISPR-associated protein Cas2
VFYVVAYDVVSDRRRTRLLELLKNYGTPVQKSVVECDLDARRFMEMRQKALAIIRPREDRLFFYRLCASCFFAAERFGGQKQPKT